MATIIFIIVLSTVLYGVVYYLNVSKKNALKAEGRIIDRDAVFFKREHTFECSVPDIRKVGEAIDKNVLGSESISFEPDYDRGIIVFHNNTSFGTFGASLRAAGNEDGVYTYRFKVDAWRERNGNISRQDHFGANVLLTAIEKAFLRIDPQTKVSDNATKITRKHNLF